MDENQLKETWNILEHSRNDLDFRDPLSIISALYKGGVNLTSEVFDYIATRVGGTGELYLPSNLTRFMLSLIPQKITPSVLEPWRVVSTRQVLIEELSIKNHDILTPHQRLYDMLTEIYKQDIYFGNPVDILVNSAETYDIVFATPPWGILKDRDSNKVKIGEIEFDLDSLAIDEKIILLSMSRLNDNGIGIALVSPLFYLNTLKKRKFNDILKNCGLFINAVIGVPKGTFSHTTIGGLILSISRVETQKLFVAEFSSDLKHQEQIRGNYFQMQKGAYISQGEWVVHEEFHDIHQLLENEKLLNITKRMSLEKITFGDIVDNYEINRGGNSFKRFPEAVNNVYLPLMASTPATTSQELLPPKLKSYLKLAINPQMAESSYVAAMLNSEVGLIIRETAKRGYNIPSIMPRELLDGPFFIAPLDKQKQISDMKLKIMSVQREIDYIEKELWKKPESVIDFNETLDSIDTAIYPKPVATNITTDDSKLPDSVGKERIVNWIESLPFPLATVLWRYQAAENSHKIKFDRLLVFFEVLAKFISVIHLSGLVTNEIIWQRIKVDMNKMLKKNGLSIDRATFGTWVELASWFSKQVRIELEKDTEFVKEVYHCLDIQLIKSISNKDISAAIKIANQYRNEMLGHTGAHQESSYETYRIRLEEQLSIVMDSMNNAWGNSQLVQPITSKYNNGSHLYQAFKIMGTRTPFENITLDVKEPMQDGDLYFNTFGETRSLKILPFIKIMAAPTTAKHACYFYDRLSSSGDELRFLSYHYEEDSDVTKAFPDTMEIIGDLFN